MYKFVLGIFLLFLAQSSCLALNNDIPGSKDHPLISRYPLSYIAKYSTREFDEYVLLTGSINKDTLDVKPNSTLVLEGKVTKIQYHIDGRSTLEVYRNYINALEKEGFEIIFQKQGKSYLETFQFVSAFLSKYNSDYRIYPGHPRFTGNDFRYFSAKLDHCNGEIYISCYVTTQTDTLIQLDIIEITPMKSDMIEVQTDFIKRGNEYSRFIPISRSYFTPYSILVPILRPCLYRVVNPKSCLHPIYVLLHTCPNHI